MAWEGSTAERIVHGIVIAVVAIIVAAVVIYGLLNPNPPPPPDVDCYYDGFSTVCER